MKTSISMFTLVSAIAGADAYALGPAAGAEPTQAIAMRAAADALRHVRVDLYCDHDARAAAGLRAARLHLQTAAGAAPAPALLALERAAWSLRHHRYAQAEQALGEALDQVTAAAPVSSVMRAPTAAIGAHDGHATMA